jgi:ATP-dependent exoDNAse (exonuclease V) beta subunit
MKDVFADAGLRLRWRNYDHDIDSSENFVINLKNILPSFKNILDFKVNDLPTAHDGKWYLGLKNVLECRGAVSHDLFVFLAFIKAVKEVNFRSTPNEKDFPDCNFIYKLLKEFRDDFVNKYIDAIEVDLDTDLKIRNSWNINLSQLFKQIDSDLCNDNSLTFADLEFYSYLLLKDKQTSFKISQNFDYFIIDEFQDTSILQLEIIEGLIQNNFKKLFVVGDLKQAIYGFRGGKTSVFEHVIKNTELLELNFNYRSDKRIVNFNNKLFQSILNLGLEYKGEARNKILVSDQLPVKEEINDQVGVYCLKVKMPEELSPSSIKAFEALILIDKIKAVRKKFPNDSIAILYKNLNPSLDLIKQLKVNNIGFRSQIKINRTEDPIWALFELYLSLLIKADPHKEFVLANILKHLEVKKIPIINSSDFDFFGPYLAFINFLELSGLSISNYKTNLEHIEKIIETTGENINEIIRYLESYFEFKDSSYIEQGENSQLVTIMTVHASKGLEFDHVFLGGISDNSRRNPKDNSTGCWPGSYKWKKSYKEPKLIPSLPLILEIVENKFEESAEMKRLFYVACTRAKKCLFWPEMWDIKDKVYGHGPESWINALIKSKESEVINLNFFTEEQVDLTHFQSSKTLYSPSFHENWVGVFPRETGRSVEVYSELSVTNFLSINECPRKFYFKNVCKLDEQINFQNVDGEELNFISSKARGSKLHRDLENYIKKDEGFNGLEEIKKTIDTKKISHNLFSEYSVKFNIPVKNFGQMISGTIDLLLVPNDKKGIYEVWDFKTGLRKADETQYFSQLLMYSYAVFEQFKIDQNTQMILKIIYLDTNEIIEKSVKSLEAKDYVRSLWCKTHQLTQINPNHCNYCDYQSICTKK